MSIEIEQNNMMCGGEYMLIYAGTKSDFMIDTENDRLETKLYENIKLKMNCCGQAFL